MWSVAGIKAANADYLAKQEPLRRAREELDRIAEFKNSGVVKPRSNTKERNMFRNSRPGNSPTVPVKPFPKHYGVNRKSSITGLLKGLNIHRYDDTNGLERFDSLRISSSGNSPTVHVETIPNPDELSDEMESNTPRPELDQYERPIKPLYGGKKRKSKRMKSRYRKKYKGTRNNKTRRYIK